MAAEIGRRADLPVYVHFGQLWGLPESGTNGEDVDTILARVIPLLREGDVLAHPFTRHPGGFVNREGEVHPVIQAALDRGLKVDVGHGSHFSYRLAKKALAAGIVPTTLGADIHGYNTHVPAPAGTPDQHEDDENHPFAGQAKFSLVQAMSSMMALGLTLEQVVPMVTSKPARMLGRADVRLAGLQDVAFVRSPLAHALIRGIHVPERYRDSVFTAADLAGVNPIRAVSGLPGFKISEQPVLAIGKVRQVGELVAMCVAPTRADAEDIAAAVTLDLEELPAVHDMLKAREPGSALVHEHWGDNVFLETNFEVDISSALDAPIKVSREISTARQCMSHRDGRGVVGTIERRLHHPTPP